MGKALRKTVDFSADMYEQVKAHGEERGCRSFGEAVRDLIRLGFQQGTSECVVGQWRVERKYRQPKKG